MSFSEKFEQGINDKKMCRLINDDTNSDNISNCRERFGRRKLIPFIKSFLLADATFLTSQIHSNIYGGMTGACAVVCHIDEDWVTTAWTGDCRALVGKKIYDPIKNEYVWQCVELTHDHQVKFEKKKT